MSVMMWVTGLGVVGGLLYLAHRWAQGYYSYWRDKGVPGPTPWPFLGNSNYLTTSPTELYTRLYRDYPTEKTVGFYELLKKRLLVRDPELVRKVLIKDFAAFCDRAEFNADDSNPLDSSLFTMRGAKWRSLRNKITPAFTTGRLRTMFPQMYACTSHLLEYIEERASVDVAARDLFCMFTVDVIATCAFGIEVNKMNAPDSEFRRKSTAVFAMSAARILRLSLVTSFPVLGRVLGTGFVPADVARYFEDVIRQTLERRRKSGEVRNDFVDLLLQLKEKGSLQWTSTDDDDRYLTHDAQMTPLAYEITEEVLMGQAFTFLTAGSEPASNTLTFALLELARNPDIQEKARREVEEAVLKHGGFIYEAVKDMLYLERCILETLRMYPVGQQLLRMCTRQCVLEPGAARCDLGTNIIVPVRALHYDPKYHPEPFKFNPERFNPGEEPPHGSFLPFGEGPRMCIGMRFAMVEMKVALARILHNYRILESPKTGEVKLNRWSFFSVPQTDIFITFIKLPPPEAETFRPAVEGVVEEEGDRVADEVVDGEGPEEQDSAFPPRGVALTNRAEKVASSGAAVTEVVFAREEVEECTEGTALEGLLNFEQIVVALENCLETQEKAGLIHSRDGEAPSTDL